MSYVPGQGTQGLEYQRSSKANENIAFAFYYPEGNQPIVYVFENGLAEEIVWEETPNNFNPYYRGQLGNKYYFFSVFGEDGFLYEYDHDTGETKKIPFPQDYTCNSTLLLTDNFNDKIYLSCGDFINGDKAILSFDGNNFEAFDSPPNYGILMEDYMFVDHLDQILIWYYEIGTHNNGAQLYSFDGVNLTHIPNPANNLLSERNGILFENDLILPYANIVNSTENIYSLYRYDGFNLVEVPGLPNELYENMRIMEAENKFYIALDNFSSLISSLYQFDENGISEIYNSTFFYPHFLSEFNGKDMFSLADTNQETTGLYALEESDFEQIIGAEADQPIAFSGILEDKLYLSYFDSSTATASLYSYTSGSNNVELVNDVPQDLKYGKYDLKINNQLLHIFVSNYEYSLFSQDQNNQFENLNPENYILSNFEFQLQNKVYYSFYDSDYKSHMFVWDGTLNTEDYILHKNDIVIYPNPASTHIILEIPEVFAQQKTEISIFSIEGKMVKNVIFDSNSSQVQLSIENLMNGIYLLEVKSESEIFRKKIIKK